MHKTPNWILKYQENHVRFSLNVETTVLNRSVKKHIGIPEKPYVSQFNFEVVLLIMCFAMSQVHSPITGPIFLEKY